MGTNNFKGQGRWSFLEKTPWKSEVEDYSLHNRPWISTSMKTPLWTSCLFLQPIPFPLQMMEIIYAQVTSSHLLS
jgi:hypothetical protein